MENLNQLESARDAFFVGVAHFEAQRLPEARAAFAQALELAPGRTSVMLNLGVTEVYLGNFRPAVALLEAALGAEPESTDGWIALALAQFECANWAGAAHACEQSFARGVNQIPVRLQYAKCLTRLGNLSGARDAYRAILAQDESVGEAWYQLGDLQREAAETVAAIDSYRQALAHGVDQELVNYVLSALKAQAPVLQPPRAYVLGLFDQYANDFEDHLVGQLGYCGHTILIKHLPNACPPKFANVLDLGCGTGLCAPLIRARAEQLVGVDLSPAMIEKSRSRGQYDNLSASDIHEFLSNDTSVWDLVIAADVFIYIGDLRRLLSLLALRIRSGGWLAFTVESAPAGRNVQLLPSLRYAHSLDYLSEQATQHGFTVESVRGAPIRVEQGRAELGRYLYWRKT